MVEMVGEMMAIVTGLSELTYVKYLEQFLAHGEAYVNDSGCY